MLTILASFNERLLLGNGLCVSPLKGPEGDQGMRSLRDVVFQIDNSRDLNNYISSFASKVGSTGDIRYERHPVRTDCRVAQCGTIADLLQTLALSQQTPPASNTRTQPLLNQQSSTFSVPPVQAGPPPPVAPQSFSQSSAPPIGSVPNNVSQDVYSGSPRNQNFLPGGAGGPPQLPPAQLSTPLYSQPPTPMGLQTHQSNSSHSSLPALRPVFGLSLEDLLKRDGSAIPLVVYQCIQAVDLYGLEVEGIYRLSGSSTHVSKLKSIFDHGMLSMLNLLYIQAELG